MNIFEYIQAYAKLQRATTYGDLLNNQSTDDKIESMFDSREREAYLQLKMQDKMRILGENLNLQNQYYQVQPGQQLNINGIGVVQLIC